MYSHRATQVALAAAALFAVACHHEKPATATPGGDDASTPGTASTAAAADTKATKIKCSGANACAEQGACDVPDGRVEPGSKGHDCAGNNTCKGKGWVLLTAADCTEQHGEPL
jgi:hypothetical protein